MAIKKTAVERVEPVRGPRWVAKTVPLPDSAARMYRSVNCYAERRRQLLCSTRLPQWLVSKLAGMAYEQHHAYGYAEVDMHLCEMVRDVEDAAVAAKSKLFLDDAYSPTMLAPTKRFRVQLVLLDPEHDQEAQVTMDVLAEDPGHALHVAACAYGDEHLRYWGVRWYATDVVECAHEVGPLGSIQWS